MEEINDLMERLDNGNDIDKLRLDIANIIAKRLYEKRDELGYFDKLTLGNAIGYLRGNMLRACLGSLQNSWASANQRNNDYAPISPDIEALKYKDLMFAVRELGGDYWRVRVRIEEIKKVENNEVRLDTT